MDAARTGIAPNVIAWDRRLCAVCPGVREGVPGGFAVERCNGDRAVLVFVAPTPGWRNAAEGRSERIAGAALGGLDGIRQRRMEIDERMDFATAPVRTGMGRAAGAGLGDRKGNITPLPNARPPRLRLYRAGSA